VIPEVLNIAIGKKRIFKKAFREDQPHLKYYFISILLARWLDCNDIFSPLYKAFTDSI